MFTGFVKSMPIAIEEAAMIDGCNPLQIFFQVVCPILKPTMISTAILETMWVWNDYLLPTLVLDIKTYRTIPMAIQYFRGSYGKVEMAPMMACIMITILPVIILYLICQKYIIDGVVAGAVKLMAAAPCCRKEFSVYDHQRYCKNRGMPSARFRGCSTITPASRRARAKILEVIKRYNYQPNSNAKHLKQQSSDGLA